MLRLEALPDYDKMNQLFKQAQAPVEAADVHGIIAGTICAGGSLNVTAMLDAAADIPEGDHPVIKATRKAMMDIYDFSARQLYDASFEFDLLLPHEDEVISQRSRALSQWCQGFLYGFGLSGLELEDANSQDGIDALECIVEIAKLEYHDVEATEKNERTLFDLEEFVKVSVMIIYNEFFYMHANSEEEPVLH